MDVLVYQHSLGSLVRGLTNQVLLMLNHLVVLQELSSAHNNYANKYANKYVVFLDHFYAHFEDDRSRCSFSSILDLDDLNRTYFPNIAIVDLHDIPSNTLFSLGIHSKHDDAVVPIPLTHLIPFIVSQRTLYDANIRDPAVGIPKKFCLEFSSQGRPHPKIYIKEYAGKMNRVAWEQLPGWARRIDGLDMTRPLIRRVLKGFVFRRDGTLSTTSSSKDTIPKSPSGKYSIVHLRNESDANHWWCRGNNMSPLIFGNKLDQLYIRLITENIDKGDMIVFLTARTTNNPVISALQEKGYHVYLHPKKDGRKREISAIDDLMLAEGLCNSVLVSPTGGSTFANWLALRLEGKYTKLVHINLQRLG